MTKQIVSQSAGIERRQFVARATSTALGLMATPTFGQSKSDDSLQLLSHQGCGRATGYAEANKIVTASGKTHVAWLDSPPQGFRVRIATLDRNEGSWSPSYSVGNAKDNHGGPALTIDSSGYLHIAYSPHHGPFFYRRSKRPHDAAEWEPEVQFGQRLTYPTMICGADNTLYFTARRSFTDRPWVVELWTKSPTQHWQRVGTVLTARHQGYAHFQESLAWGPDHRTLHLCCRFHELSDKQSYGRLQTVAYLRSNNLGRTWQRADGSILEQPITPENIDVIAKGGVDAGRTLRAGCVAVSPQGTPHLLYSSAKENKSETWLAAPTAAGRWKRTCLNESLPHPWKSCGLSMPGGLCFASTGKLYGVAQLLTGNQEGKAWGVPRNEIVMFSRDADDVVQFQAVSQFDATTPHWLPSIERPTGHNQVALRPAVLFTAGPPGKGNTELIENRVFFSGG